MNEAPRSKLRGIKSEFAEANPPSLFKLRRVRAAIHPCSKLQGILAKANKGDLVACLREQALGWSTFTCRQIQQKRYPDRLVKAQTDIIEGV